MGVKLEVPIHLAAAPDRIGSSAIRDLLAVIDRPEIISLAGGLPSPAAFPTRELAAATAAVLAEEAGVALQYASTQGHAGLREWVGRGADVDPSRIVVTHGAQQALELLVRALVDPGDAVALADPAYVGALQALRLVGARVVGIPSDRDGLRVDVLASRLADGLRLKLVYVVAELDNPTGATLSDDRREQLVDLADRYDFAIVDDDPYSALRWRGAALTPLRLRSARVITLGTVSKILAPGLRVGWAIAPQPLADVLVKMKQAVDLQTTTLTQHVAHRVLTTPGFLDGHLPLLRERYQQQCDALVTALRVHVGDRLRFDVPAGGMFLWARAAGVDARALLPRAITHGVAFVPGAEFAVASPLDDALRLSFATASAAELDEAARRLAAALD